MLGAWLEPEQLVLLGQPGLQLELWLGLELELGPVPDGVLVQPGLEHGLAAFGSSASVAVVAVFGTAPFVAFPDESKQVGSSYVAFVDYYQGCRRYFAVVVGVVPFDVPFGAVGVPLVALPSFRVPLDLGSWMG